MKIDNGNQKGADYTLAECRLKPEIDRFAHRIQGGYQVTLYIFATQHKNFAFNT